MKISIKNYVENLPTYVAGKPISEVARELNLHEKDIVKLASNENPLGFSALVSKAIVQQLSETNLYPDSNAYFLKQKLSKKLNLPADQLVFGAGSNEILDLIAKIFLHENDNAIFDEYSFIVYRLVTQSAGAEAKIAKSSNFAHNLQNFLAKIDEHTKVIFIANPNNPTGTFFDLQEFKDFLLKVPSNIVVVLDEAYIEFQENFDSLKLLEFDNLIICRTFSKAYGLAGFRIGYAITSTFIAQTINKVRAPFNVNQLALIAANAALDDDVFLQATIANNKAGYKQLTEGFKNLKIDFIPSTGNFITFNCKDDGMNTFQKLLTDGVIVRPLHNYNLANYLRVSIGTSEQNSKFLTSLARTN